MTTLEHDYQGKILSLGTFCRAPIHYPFHWALGRNHYLGFRKQATYPIPNLDEPEGIYSDSHKTRSAIIDVSRRLKGTPELYNK